MEKFKIVGKSLLGEKYVEGKRKKKERKKERRISRSPEGVLTYS